MTDLTGIQVGDRIEATVKTRTGKVQRMTGEIAAIYSRTDGTISFATVITGQSANRSKRFIDRFNVVGITVAENDR